MGYDVDRLEESDNLSKELLCAICQGVFQNPVQLSGCEHVFCKKCIETWMRKHKTCPTDRSAVEGKARSASRIIRSLVGSLRIRCSFRKRGCRYTCAIDHISDHEGQCDYDPEKAVMCNRGCGMELQPSQVTDHSCITYLRGQLDRAIKENKLMKTNVSVRGLKRKIRVMSGMIIDLETHVGKAKRRLHRLEEEIEQHDDADDSESSDDDEERTVNGFVQQNHDGDDSEDYTSD